MIISFSGTSGSGKSTIIAKILNSGTFKGKQVIVREEDSFRLIKLLKQVIGENIFSQYKDEKYLRKNYKDFVYRLFAVICYVFYPIVVYIEFLIEHIRYQLLFRRTILIGDRYIYDYLVIFRNALKINNKFVDWFYNRFPKPYLSFLIDIDMTTALKRNKNNVLGKITADRLFQENILTHYRQVAKINNLLVIENNSDLKKAIEKIIIHIRTKEKLINAKKITICGLDGTGKTTIANMFRNYVSSLSIKCAVVHFYHENLLFKLLRFLGFYRIEEPKDLLYKRSRERSERERLKATPFIMAFLRFFDSYIQYLFYTTLNRGKLIVFDRYFYDYLVSFEYLNIRPRSFFSKLIPSVTHKFLLTSNPSTSYKRKPESVRKFFVECNEIYLKIAKEHCLFS